MSMRSSRVSPLPPLSELSPKVKKLLKENADTKKLMVRYENEELIRTDREAIMNAKIEELKRTGETNLVLEGLEEALRKSFVSGEDARKKREELGAKLKKNEKELKALLKPLSARPAWSAPSAPSAISYQQSQSPRVASKISRVDEEDYEEEPVEPSVNLQQGSPLSSSPKTPDSYRKESSKTQLVKVYNKSKTPKQPRSGIDILGMANKVYNGMRKQPVVFTRDVLASYLPKIIILHYIHYKCECLKQIAKALYTLLFALLKILGSKGIYTVFKESVINKIGRFHKKLEEQIYTYQSRKGKTIKLGGDDDNDDNFSLGIINDIVKEENIVGIDNRKSRVSKQFTFSKNDFELLIGTIKDISINEITMKGMVQEDKTDKLLTYINSIFKKDTRDFITSVKNKNTHDMMTIMESANNKVDLINTYEKEANKYAKFLNRKAIRPYKKHTRSWLRFNFLKKDADVAKKDADEEKCHKFIDNFLKLDITKLSDIIGVVGVFIDSVCSHIKTKVTCITSADVKKIDRGLDAFNNIINKIIKEIKAKNIIYKSILPFNKNSGNIELT